MIFAFVSIPSTKMQCLQIPYHGRARAKKPQNLIAEHWTIHPEHEGDEARPADNSPYSKRGWESFYSEHGVFRFGETDFIINETFDHCSSTLESSFGCAFRKPVHRLHPCWEKDFKVDKFEVFMVDVSQGGYM